LRGRRGVMERRRKKATAESRGPKSAMEERLS
jgi:hypothetical protein